MCRVTCGLLPIHWRRFAGILGGSFALGIAPGWSAHGALVWEQKELTLLPTTDAKVVAGQFRFRNSGPASVTVRDVQATCGCAEVKASRAKVAPNEEGSIDFTIDADVLQGDVTQCLFVRIDGENEPIRLNLAIKLPLVAKFESSKLQWEAREAPVEKTVRVELPSGGVIRDLKVAVPASGFMVRPDIRSAPDVAVLRCVPIPGSAALQSCAYVDLTVDLLGATKQLRLPLWLAIQRDHGATPLPFGVPAPRGGVPSREARWQPAR